MNKPGDRSVFALCVPCQQDLPEERPRALPVREKFASDIISPFRALFNFPFMYYLEGRLTPETKSNLAWCIRHENRQNRQL